jgi:quercetin dioxygenase-like cupin family protein
VIDRLKEHHVPIFPLIECPRHHLPGTEFTTLATPSHGGADIRVWQVEIQPGTPAVPHSVTRSEVFVVHGGEATVTMATGEEVARAGDVLIVPPGERFQIQATGDTPFRATVCFPIDGQAVLPDKEPFTPPWGM